MFNHRWLPVLISGVCSVFLSSCAQEFTGELPCEGVATSFEFTDTDGEFTLDENGLAVTFQDGLAQRIGILSLYRTGLFAWMIPSQSTGTILFDPPAEKVSLFLKDQLGATGSELTIFDSDDQVIATFTGTGEFVEINVSTDSGATAAVSRMTLRNDGSSGFSVIDDFEACAVANGGGNGNNGGSIGQPVDNPIAEAVEFGDLSVRLTVVADGLVAPNWGIPAPGDDDHLYVVDQAGSLAQIDLTTGGIREFLNTGDRLVELGAFGPGSFDERGFLGVAFHPDYMSNGLVFTYTSEPATPAPDFSTLPQGTAPNHQSVITEWRVPDPADPDAVVDPNSARELLRIDQPQFNHNGGAVNFDADGLLYISVGDGGGADDGQPPLGHSAEGNGQDTSNPLGALLRIDPLGADSASGEYGIPPTNPFVAGGGLPEIYAFGLRNPFRFSFDTATGELFLTDVGQNDLEEINIGQAGGNYGWNIKEGTFFFQPNGEDDGTVTDVDPGSPDDLIDPIAQYDHDEGLAIVGGFVYRGTAIPELQGRYVFGDFTGIGDGGRVFFLDDDQQIVELRIEDGQTESLSILGFGQDASGEIYLMGNLTGTPFGQTGVVFRLDPV